jgi:hypothetical protein
MNIKSFVWTLFVLSVACCICGAVGTDFAVPEGSERVCLSLRGLSNAMTSALVKGEAVPEECKTLAGIGYLEGYILDDASSRDVILVGLRSKNRPNLHLDDLVANMRCIDERYAYPYCSLDPTPEHTKAMLDLFGESRETTSEEGMQMIAHKMAETVGPQQVVVGGVPRNSRHAHVMIDADYYMKKLSLGLISIDGVTSYLDHLHNEDKRRVLANEPSASTGTTMARFWFHVAEESPVFQTASDIVWIDKCDVGLRTEKQNATQEGALYDASEDDPYAVAFARDMTKHFTDCARKVQVFADLENLFRLRALLVSMDFQSDFESAGWNYSRFLSGYRYTDEKPMSDSMPGLANYRFWSHSDTKGTRTVEHLLFPLICGGVGMDIPVTKNEYRRERTTELTSLRSKILEARTGSDALSWAVR